VIPITVLEEFDQFKKGDQDKNFAAANLFATVHKASGSDTLQSVDAH